MLWVSQGHPPLGSSRAAYRSLNPDPSTPTAIAVRAMRTHAGTGAGSKTRAVGLSHHERNVGARVANTDPYTIPITAWVTRSPVYTSPRSFRTATSTTKSQSVRIISATTTPRNMAAHLPFQENHGRVVNKTP